MRCPFPRGTVLDRSAVGHAGRFAAAGGACFEKDAVGDFAGAAEALDVGEPVIASKPADGLAFVGDECERRMGTHGIAEFLEFAVDGVLPKAGLKARGSRKISMSSEKR